MLRIKAKENATIEVLDGSFPLGERNTIKVYFEDSIIKYYFSLLHTYTCIPEQNLYTYGDFRDEDDISNIVKDLNVNCSASIVSGYGINYSRCLYCCSENDLGFGTINFPLPKNTNIVPGTKYIFSVYISSDADTKATLNLENIQSIDIADGDGSFKQYKYEFVADNNTVNLNFTIIGKGSCYIDNLQLFPADQEIIENNYDNIDIKINILNPCGNVRSFGQVINYSEPESEEYYVLLYVPPITMVDMFDNILCNVSLDVNYEPKVKILGDSHYEKIKENVYLSEPFTLTGYIMPPESDRFEIVAGSI